jgi:hypothetical protein
MGHGSGRTIALDDHPIIVTVEGQRIATGGAVDGIAEHGSAASHHIGSGGSGVYQLLTLGAAILLLNKDVPGGDDVVKLAGTCGA